MWLAYYKCATPPQLLKFSHVIFRDKEMKNDAEYERLYRLSE